jgi:hypothetical protein
MASGILGQAAPLAATNTTIYTVPALTVGSFNINVMNRSTSVSAIVRVAVSATGTPGTTEYIEYGTVIPPSGVLERTGIVANATKNVVVYADTANTSVSVYGYEGAA